MKYLLTLAMILSLMFSLSFSTRYVDIVPQPHVDTILNKGIYKSYLNYNLTREPVFVTYSIYQAGGSCSRASFRFHNDSRLNVATEYAGTGYDEGHLADAADFAGNCVNEELTFRFYNCLPQTPNLNRGIWKHWESVARKESQTDSLFVVAGGIWTSNKHEGKLFIPDQCWKVIFSKTTHKPLHILLFTNEFQNNTVKVLPSVADLEKILGYKIVTS